MKLLYVTLIKIIVPTALVMASPCAFGQAPSSSGNDLDAEAQISDSPGNPGPTRSDNAKSFAATVFGETPVQAAPAQPVPSDSRGAD